MNDSSVFIITEELINEFNLLDSEGAEYFKGERAQRFLEYLTYRRCNKKAYMIPSLYEKICTSLKSEHGESLAYFKNYVQDGVIGKSADTTEEEDTISLYETLSALHDKVFIVSEKYSKNSQFENKPVLDMEKLDIYLKDKKDFMQYIQDSFYGSGY